MENKKITLILVSHNNKDILPKCIGSIINQSYKNFEIYLLDNDSSDGTPEFIKNKYPQIKFFDIPNEGPSKKRNIGISESNSGYVVTLDSDIVLGKDWLLNAIEYMENNKDVGICGGKLISPGGKIDFAGGLTAKNGGCGDIGHGQEDSPEYNTFKRVSWMTSAAAIIRRKMMNEIGGFDDDYFYGYEDSDLGIRGNISGWKIIYNPDLVATHLYHSTVSKQKSNFISFILRRNRLITFLKNFELKTILINSPNLVLSLMYELSKKDKIATLKAYFWILKNLDKIIEKRKMVTKNKVIRDKELFDKIYFPTIMSSANKTNKIITLFRNIGTRSIKDITFFITSKCNSRCKHCFYWKTLNTSKDIDLDKIEKILSKFNDIRSMTFSGGEPFLRKDIDEITKLVIKYTNPLVIDIPTNCLIDVTKKFEKMIKQNERTTFSLTCSLDGFKEEHDFIRGINGSFEKTINQIKKLNLLREKYPNFKVLNINTVLTNKNYKDMSKFINFVKTLNATSHSFDIIRGDHQKIIGPPSISEIKKFNRLRYQTAKHYNSRKPFLERWFSNLTEKEKIKIQEGAMEDKKWPFVCTAGLTDFVIESDGTARICELHTKMGDLISQTYEEILKTKEAKRILKLAKNHGCDCTHICNLSSSMNYSQKNLFFDRIINFIRPWR